MIVAGMYGPTCGSLEHTTNRLLAGQSATTLGSGVDGAVRSIAYGYDNLSRQQNITSYASAGGTGTVVNDVQFAYNDFGQVATTYQSHGGAVNTSTSPNVQSTYDTTRTGSVFSAQHRRQTIVYPNGRTVYLDYGTSGAAYGALSKVRTIRDTGSAGTALATYDYNGAGSRLALATLPQPSLKLDLFGKSGTDLLPLLGQGAAGMQRYRQQANALGLVLTTESVQAADDFGDSLATLWKQVKVGAFSIGSALLPELQQLVQTGMQVVSTVVGWVRENKSLILTVTKIALGVAAAGGVLVLLGTALSAAGSTIGVIVSAGTALAGALASAGAALAALLSPIGIVGVAVVDLGGYFLATSDEAAEAVEWMKAKFDELLGDATSAFAGIRDALAAGDFGLAMKVVGSLLQLEWQKALLFLQEKWIGFKEFFLSIWTEATFGLSKLFVDAWAGIETGWQETIDFLSDAWTVFSDFIMENWNSAVGFIEKAWVRLKSLFDEDVDVAGETDRINQEVAGKNASRTDARNKTLLDREAQRRQREQDIEQQRVGANEELDRARAQAHADRENRTIAALAGAEENVEKARADFAASIAEAARKREEAEAGKGPDVTKLRRRAEGAEANAEAASGPKSSIRGTFNAAAAQGLAGGNAADRTAKATEETAKNTKRLLQAANQGGLQFS